MKSKFNFKKDWHSFTPSQKKELAKRIESSVAHLANIANNHKTPSNRFFRIIEIETVALKAEVEKDAKKAKKTKAA